MIVKSSRRLILAGMLILFSISIGFAQKSEPTGTVEGKLIDADTKSPLTGAEITIDKTVLGAATDLDGKFVIENVPVGSYTLRFTYIGYETQAKTDVIVRPRRITFVEAELKTSPIQSDEVVVTAGYFEKSDQQPLSVTTFSREEIRRAPGSAGDVSRIIMGLPSLAKVNDQSNSLIVRGGSPLENAFFIDNIEIPNINHFPTQGASGGPIGMINVDLINDVSFSTGGFSAVYGDRLSSVMNIALREGNRQEFDGQLDLNFTGFGGVFEGPVFNQKGSYLLSLRRSYLDFLVKSIDIGTSIAPVYGDVQGKFVYDVSPRHKLTFLEVWGDDHNNPDQKTAVENDMITYGNQDIYENTTGANWRALWDKSGYSNTSLAYTSDKFREDAFETGSGLHLVKNRSLEQSFKFRNLNHFRLSKKYSIEFGADVKHLVSDYDNYYAEFTGALGDTTPATIVGDRISATKMGGFFNFILEPFSRFTAIAGLRTDYFTYNRNFTISPRFSFSLQFSDKTSLNGSTGLFYQNLPLLLLSQNSENRNLSDPMATHYILGIDHLLTPATKLTLEIYDKEYRHFPIDPTQPSLFLVDELYYRYGFFLNHEWLNDTGRAYSRGVELTVQKKLAQDFYGLASASWFRSRYEGSDGKWRDRSFDNRLIFSLEGGYKPNSKWEFSMRWIYAGGVPYTPFDLQESQAIDRAVLDESRINQARYPDYHSLNVRFDRRFSFSSSNIVFYFSVWNAYSRKNVAQYFWNQNENKPDTIYQWTLLPIFGLEYEF